MLKVRLLATIDSSGCPPSKAGVRGFVPVFFPALRQPEQFSRWHLHQRDGLPALGDQDIIFRASDPERAPKSRPLEAVKPTLDYQSIPKLGCAAIIDLRVNDNRIPLRFRHFRQGQTEFFGEQRAGDFDEAQIDDVGDDSTAIGVEKHHLQLSANARHGGGHKPTIIPKRFRKQW